MADHALVADPQASIQSLALALAGGTRSPSSTGAQGSGKRRPAPGEVTSVWVYGSDLLARCRCITRGSREGGCMRIGLRVLGAAALAVFTAGTVPAGDVPAKTGEVVKSGDWSMTLPLGLQAGAAYIPE